MSKRNSTLPQLVDVKIRLPGSTTPTVAPLHKDMTSSDAVGIVTSHLALKENKLSLVLPTSFNRLGRILDEDAKVASLNLDPEEILELQRSPYVAKAAIADGTNSINDPKEIILDHSTQLVMMIPNFQRVFNIREPIIFQYVYNIDEDISPKQFNKSRWLNALESLTNQRVSQESGYILISTMSLLEKIQQSQIAFSEMCGVLTKQSFRKNQSTKAQKRYFVLHGNVLYYFKTKADSKPKGAIMLEYYNLKTTNNNSSWILTLTRSYEGFLTRRGEMFVLAGNEKEVKSWAEVLLEKCNNSGSKKEFGVDLKQLTKRRNVKQNIPVVVRDCIEYLLLDETRIQAEGIFRISGSIALIEYYKNQYDQGEGNAALSDCTDFHTVAGLLKLYFRELPEPLFTWDLYDSLINVIGDDDEISLSKFSPILSTLPQMNFDVLCFLVQFLVQVASFSSINKMSEANLSTVFAPNLLRPRHEDVTLLMQQSAQANKLFELILRNPDCLHRVDDVRVASGRSATLILKTANIASAAAAAAQNRVKSQILVNTSGITSTSSVLKITTTEINSEEVVAPSQAAPTYNLMRRASITWKQNELNDILNSQKDPPNARGRTGFQWNRSVSRIDPRELQQQIEELKQQLANEIQLRKNAEAEIEMLKAKLSNSSLSPRSGFSSSGSAIVPATSSSAAAALLIKSKKASKN
eukprot:TRINITY_DN4122_c1_g2_i1.p1 TRINITY_DN4122_c1_g2~~TRINITY_DN4122_c1_g2_i1.p1  ORF type:complete len:695 (-),score=269.29 TRINITY_DN4122_c1_g2_i1:159-2243(-)